MFRIICTAKYFFSYSTFSRGKFCVTIDPTYGSIVTPIRVNCNMCHQSELSATIKDVALNKCKAAKYIPNIPDFYHFFRILRTPKTLAVANTILNICIHVNY